MYPNKADNNYERYKKVVAELFRSVSSLNIYEAKFSAVINHKVINKTIKGKNLPRGSATSLPAAILPKENPLIGIICRLQ